MRLCIIFIEDSNMLFMEDAYRVMTYCLVHNVLCLKELQYVMEKLSYGRVVRKICKFARCYKIGSLMILKSVILVHILRLIRLGYVLAISFCYFNKFVSHIYLLVLTRVNLYKK